MVKTIDTSELENVTDAAQMKALRRDINCVGIALSKCLGQSQKDIVVRLINKGIIASAEDLQLDGSIPKACAAFSWPKLFPKGETWTKTRDLIAATPTKGQRYFMVNWGTNDKEGFDQKKIFHAFTVEIGESDNGRGKTHAHIHIKGGNIKDYDKQLDDGHWVSAWKVT